MSESQVGELEEIDAILRMQDGWHGNSEGKAVNKKGLLSLARDIKDKLPYNIPYVYPCASGGVVLEWSNYKCDLELTVDKGFKASTLVIHESFMTEDPICHSFDLSYECDWEELVSIVCDE